MSNLNSLLHKPIESTPIQFHQWKGIEGTFVSIVWNSLLENRIDPTKVFIQKIRGKRVDVWKLFYGNRRRTIRRSTGMSADLITKIILKMK